MWFALPWPDEVYTLTVIVDTAAAFADVFYKGIFKVFPETKLMFGDMVCAYIPVRKGHCNCSYWQVVGNVAYVLSSGSKLV